MRRKLRVSCIASSFYIKPQHVIMILTIPWVVLHPLSTSNHNCQTLTCCYWPLYCILFLHQTTTSSPRYWSVHMLYCILFLHQTTTRCTRWCYIGGCIASSFYIKPQQSKRCKYLSMVVLHPLSTSNHNRASRWLWSGRVVLHPLSTSNHNPRTPDTLIFGHLTASRHDTKRGGVHRGSRFDAVFTFSTNIRKIIFTEIRRCMSVQRAGARLRSDSSEANI